MFSSAFSNFWHHIAHGVVFGFIWLTSLCFGFFPCPIPFNVVRTLWMTARVSVFTSLTGRFWINKSHIIHQSSWVFVQYNSSIIPHLQIRIYLSHRRTHHNSNAVHYGRDRSYPSRVSHSPHTRFQVLSLQTILCREIDESTHWQDIYQDINIPRCEVSDERSYAD